MKHFLFRPHCDPQEDRLGNSKLKKRLIAADICIVATLTLCISVMVSTKPIANTSHKNEEQYKKQQQTQEEQQLLPQEPWLQGLPLWLQKDPQQVTKFETFLLEHRAEIEAVAHEYYQERLAEYEKHVQNIAIWEKYKDSKNDALFDQAVDAWNAIPDEYSSQLLCFNFVYDSMDTLNSAVAWNNGPTMSFTDFYNTLWSGRLMPPNLPTELPALDIPQDFPQYEGSPRAIEDKAKELFDRFRRTSEDTTILLKTAMLYNDHVTKNAEVLERRGFFIDYPVELKTSGHEQTCP